MTLDFKSAQWFSRWRYEAYDPIRPDAWLQSGDDNLEEVPGYRRVDNITDWCLQRFRHQYPDQHITKDDIWHYLYGILHAPDYREKYRADLSKDLPRIPFAADFGAFRDAGAELAALHLGYETGPQYKLIEQIGHGPNPYQLSASPMKWGGTRKEPDRSVLHVTPHVTLHHIPAAAHRYVVNGRTPLEWAVDRLHIRQDKESGIVNDPNAWFADEPRRTGRPPPTLGVSERGDDAHCGRAAPGASRLNTNMQNNRGVQTQAAAGHLPAPLTYECVPNLGLRSLATNA